MMSSVILLVFNQNFVDAEMFSIGWIRDCLPSNHSAQSLAPECSASGVPAKRSNGARERPKSDSKAMQSL
jgi:hypothetical protein